MGYEPIRSEPVPIHLLKQLSKDLDHANEDVIRHQRMLMKSLERLRAAGVAYANTLVEYEMTSSVPHG